MELEWGAMPQKAALHDLNPLITCKICKGYFIDATTITECLHTFCRSCIVKHFKKSLCCPECEVQVERGCPLNKLRPDPRKQLLVYKVVPRLHQNEVARQWNFLKKYRPLTPFSHPYPGIYHSGPRPLLPGDLPEDETVRDRIVDKIHVYAPEDKISLSLEYDGIARTARLNGLYEDPPPPGRRYLQAPAAVTMHHLKKFLRLKYEIHSMYKITICYDGEPLSDESSLMDVAYQFFYEAKAPMRFTFRVVSEPIVRKPASSSSNGEAIPAKPTTSTILPNPASSVRPPSQMSSTNRNSVRGSASSAASSSDEGSASTRRQQRQRSAKTAAYTAIEAMDESDHEEEPRKRRRLPGKSPRWESASPEPYTVYRNTRRTPKTCLEDFEARYNNKPAKRRVYAPCTDDEMSDQETKKNTIANQRASAKYNHINDLLKVENGPKHATNGKRPRSRRVEEDVYDFNSQNEDNEDSNTTQEFDFVYDNSDHESAGSTKKRGHSETNSESRDQSAHSATVSEEGDEVNDMDADDQEFEQQIEMEVVTDTDDIDQHIEDSIEEVEVDADDENGGNEDEEERAQSADIDDDENDHQLEAESSCLVIAEDEEDDGVVEEVIAAEEDGHELVVVEDPEEADVTYTVEVFNVSAPSTDNSEKEDSSRSPGNSLSSKSPTVEEDEPQIVHEKVFRKKSKKSKHHHHHHHHKRRRHHSPVMLISSPEEAPMKLTLKLRPTPSISPSASSSKVPNKSPLPESPTKDRKISMSFSPRRDGEFADLPRSQKIYSVKITSPKPDDTDDANSGSHRPISRGTKAGKSEETSVVEASPSRNGGCDSLTSYAKSPTHAPAQPEKQPENPENDRKAVPDEVKERLTQMRQVRIKSVANTSTPASPPPSPSPVSKSVSSPPDLTSVKTPSSLTISKLEAGEKTPQRVEEPSNKPALEILVLPPSPPPSDKLSDDSEECSASSEPPAKKMKEADPPSAKRAGANDLRLNAANDPDETGVLDLSDRTKRDSVPSPQGHTPTVSPISKSQAHVQFHPPQQLQQMQVTVGNQQMRSIHHMMGEATLATMKRVSGMLATTHVPKLPMLPLYRDQVLSAAAVTGQPRRMSHSLHDILGNRPVNGFAMPTTSASRPGPNQSVRQIPNPSALLHRQKSSLQLDKEAVSKQQGQLTEQQLKERYQQFQQNRAAKAAFTYSRVNSAPAGSRGASMQGGPVVGGSPVQPISSHGLMPMVSPSLNVNNNIAVKTAFRPRSIEKVAGLLSVRAGAYALISE